MSADITYATKVWRGEFIQVLQRHKNAELIIANNLGKQIVDIGDTEDKYYLPELEAVKRCKTKYILWYAADVIPPETDWVSEALPLLEEYPIVTCNHTNLDKYRAAELFSAEDVTDFGWTTYFFSDQCYLSTTEYMQNIDYESYHPIRDKYPPHGGNSFECRVAQWLANQQTPLAVLSNHTFQHIPSETKQYEQ